MAFWKFWGGGMVMTAVQGRRGALLKIGANEITSSDEISIIWNIIRINEAILWRCLSSMKGKTNVCVAHLSLNFKYYVYYISVIIAAIILFASAYYVVGNINLFTINQLLQRNGITITTNSAFTGFLEYVKFTLHNVIINERNRKAASPSRKKSATIEMRLRRAWRCSYIVAS